MAKQKTYSQRKHERSLRRKKEHQDQRTEDKEESDVPLLNVRIAISAVVTLLAIAVALKVYEVPVEGASGSSRLNMAGAGIDDANIFFTYAKNVAEGHGAVYYAGGQPVEGYSSTLFMLLCTVGMLVTTNIEFYVLLMNALFMCGVLVTLQAFLHGLARERLPDESSITVRQLRIVNWAASILLWVWVVGSPGFVIWTTVTMMDVGLWTLVFTAGSVAAVSSALHPQRTSGSLHAWIVLMLLTRPESYYLCLVWIGAVAVARVKQGNRVTAAVGAVKFQLLTFLAVVVGITVCRYFYFGYLLPNTYYAKVSSDFFYNLKLGFGYLGEFVKAEPWAGLAFLLCGVALIRGLGTSWKPEDGNAAGSTQQAVTMLAFITLLGAVTPILTGGDHFNYFRFFQPYWPLMGIIGLYFFRKYLLIESLPTMRKPIRVGLTTVALAGTMLLAQTPPWPALLQSPTVQPTLMNEFQLALGGRHLGELLNQWNDEISEQSAGETGRLSLGTLTTGGVGYTYAGPVLDMLGLNNVQMAHSQGDRKGNKNHAAFHKDTFFELSPDLFAPRSQRKRPTSRAEVFPFSKGNEFWIEALKGLDEDPRFLAQYAPVELVQRSDDGAVQRRCTLWVRKSLLPLVLEKPTPHFSVSVITANEQ